MKKILITAPVHQDIKIFKEYLWSLNRLEIPEGYEIHKYFYLHNSPNLKKFLHSDEYEVFNDNTRVEENNITHIWKLENFNAVAEMRTKALEYARKNNFDYIFSVDSDIILHKKTLIDLISREKDLISKAYWTVWDNRQPWNVLPNFYDERNEKGVFFKKDIDNYKIIGTYEVGVTCGPILISSKIFNEPLVNYYPIKILSNSYWEDYAFAIRCKCIFPNIKIYTDTIHPARHLYRKKDYEEWKTKEKIQWEKEF